jgi:6-pyruvoyltetrahydropterin/6-carboxytetrahydropterin synthase
MRTRVAACNATYRQEGLRPVKSGGHFHPTFFAMIFELSQAFFFDAAHTLQRDIETDSSQRIHGHTYHAQVSVRGPVDAQTGMVMDGAYLRRATEKIKAQLDHHLLDNVPGLNEPTLENLCQFIYRYMLTQTPLVCAVMVERRATGDQCVLRA